MEQVHSPDAAREIASFRERLRALRNRGRAIVDQQTPASPKLRNDAQAARPGKPVVRDDSDIPWSDTQWTDTVFDSGER
jgi:hypothetical protein